MKQHITVEQIQELTPEQQQKLMDWWKPDIGNYVFYQETDEYGEIFDREDCICNVWGWKNIIYLNHLIDGGYKEILTEKATPLLDIGQMIELLGKEKSGRVIMREWQDNELCDALWEAVKAVL